MKILIMIGICIAIVILCFVGLRHLFNVGTIDIDLTFTPEDIYREEEKPVDMALTQGRTKGHVKRNENTAINCMIIIVIIAIAASYFALN